MLGLTGGETYLFKVRALNVYGAGEFSETISQRMSNVPGKPVMVTVDLQGTDVLISWTQPDENFEPITSYKIDLRTHDDQWIVDTTNCDAS